MRLTWKYRGLPRCVCDGMRSSTTGIVRPMTSAEASRRLQDLEKHGERQFDEKPRLLNAVDVFSPFLKDLEGKTPWSFQDDTNPISTLLESFDSLRKGK